MRGRLRGQGPGLRRAERFEEIEVGSVILALGFEEFNPEARPEYGYGRFDNVVTSIEFERMLSATGPFSRSPCAPRTGTCPRGSPGSSVGLPRQGARLLLFGLLHVCHQGGHHLQGAPPLVEPTIFFMDIAGPRQGV